ncbi:hypothetical protein N7527_009110 [Penicillium freii]|uniref:Uncharacterized protein n=1 Tax=Penicillium freii TaxID=48697 RepID=A0A101MG28_PENFR|nr:hypothetical protein N7527_009110 [Penicillium freii]KUM59944.1 hypothetical protein ACN42_g7189 [Penicillium freii]
MPFETQEPWKRQLYAGTECPEHVVIPLKDYNAYYLNPAHRWVYNKLEIAEKQGLLCAPHGLAPSKFPVFSKPIYNIRNLGAGTRLLEDMEDYHEHCSSGHMWSELLQGDHISTDMAVLNGKVVWLSHTLGIPSGGGTFDRWEVNVTVSQEDERALVGFVELHLPDYTGMLNAETIGGQIIEMHLRFTNQWPDLYPRGFLDAVVGLYQGKWCPTDEMVVNDTRGFSVVLFGTPKTESWAKPEMSLVEAIRSSHSLYSVQMPFTEGLPARHHAHPPGGYQLAIFNGPDLLQCLKAREDFKNVFSAVNSWSSTITSHI